MTDPESAIKQFSAPGPLTDDGSWIHYETVEGFVVTGENRDDEYLRSDVTVGVRP